jgi:hypothetical protein
MRNTGKACLIAVAVAALSFSFVPAAVAATTATDFHKTHPRRAEVNQRLNNQDKRVDSLAAHGKITAGQAARLHRQDHRIHAEEHRMAAREGGHITAAQQAKLNRQENRVNKRILGATSAQ